MKRYLSLLLLPLVSCALLMLPITLLNIVIKGIGSLFNGILNAGSALATQAAKYAPYALFFVEGTEQEVEGEGLTLLATTLEESPLEIQDLGQGLAAAPDQATAVLLLDPADLLSEERRIEVAALLRGKNILGSRWIRGEAPPRPLLMNLPR